LIVVDASVLVNALADDEDAGDAARARLLGHADLHAPHVVDLEVLSVLRRAVGARRLDTRRARLALDDLHDLRLTRYPHAPFARRIWELRQNLTPYDAAYVALAEELDCSLLTADERLARSPRLPCAVEVLR
jgi:predicted nucleic acid-binding protein